MNILPTDYFLHGYISPFLLVYKPQKLGSTLHCIQVDSVLINQLNICGSLIILLINVE